MAMTSIIDKKKRRRNNIIGSIVIVVLAVAVIITVVFAFNMQNKKASNEDEVDYHTMVYNDKTYQYNASIVSILLMGIDTEDPTQVQGQADAIEMLLLDRENKKIQIVTIPRDTMTEIRLFDVSGNDLGWQKQHLNLAYAYGSTPETGCIYTSQAVSRMLSEIPMTRYAALNLNMIEKVQDIVGTLKVVIPNNSLESVNASWKKGKTIDVTSKNVENYLRTRDTNVDFSNEPRMERQKEYLIAFFNSLKQKLEKDFDNTVTKVYDVIKEMTTNITYSDMEDFANMVLEYEFDSEKDFYTLEGKNVSGSIHDEFELDQNSLKSLILKLFYTNEEESR